MKNLGKLLAVILLGIVIIAFGRSAVLTKAAGENICFGPGNNMIDNIGPEVLKNLRAGVGNPDCYIIATFLWRPNDLTDTASPDPGLDKLSYFLKVASEQKVIPIIRIGSENSGNIWPAITPSQAAAFGQKISQAASKYGGTFYVELGNEINFDNEWSPRSNPDSYADAFISFANSVSAGNVKIILPPLTLNDAAAQIKAEDYYRQFFDALVKKLANNFNCSLSDPTGKCQGKVSNWMESEIKGFGMNLYPPPGVSSQAGLDYLLADKEKALKILSDQFNRLNSQFGLSLSFGNKEFVITEIGIANGEYSSGAGAVSCQFWLAIKAGNLGSQFVGATIYSRDQQSKVHAFYFPNNTCGGGQEYQKGLINLGGSTTYGSGSGVPPVDQISFLPLGTLQTCPPEIPVVGEAAPPVQGVVASCSTAIPPLAEPEVCQHPELLKSNAKLEQDYCSGLGRWCYPESQKIFESRGGYDCSHGRNPNPYANWGQLIKAVCLGEKANPNGSDGEKSVYETLQAGLRCYRGDRNIDSKFAGSVDIGRCLVYWSTHAPPNGPPPQSPPSDSRLPACVPTSNLQNQCVSECSEPLDVVQDLKFNLIGDCAKNPGTCYAEIKIKDKAFYLPFAEGLADYFAGTLDAEHFSPESLDSLQTALRKGYTDPNFTQAFNNLGVARKLFPAQVQDDLKNKFINYVKQKKANLQNNSGESNTKYVFVENGKLKEFEVGGVPITQIEPPPVITNFKNSADYSQEWGKWFNKWGTIWAAVPLFNNDESQGEIQFVSPSLFSIKPISVSIPEIQRLDQVTQAIQNLLVPRAGETTPPPTYGREITHGAPPPNNACAPTKSWDYYYSGQAYQRAVVCNIKPDPVTGPPISKICTLGPDGQIRCDREDTSANVPTGNKRYTGQDAVVQVRTVFPHFYGISEQTISFLSGLLHIFRPGSEQTFADHYAPTPAYVDNVKYELTNSSGLELQESQTNKEKGWKINFFNLGGVFNAKQFVMQMIYPLQQNP